MKKSGPVPKYHTPGKDSQNYFSNPAVLANVSDFLVKGDYIKNYRGMKETAKLGLTNSAFQYHPISYYKNIFYNGLTDETVNNKLQSKSFRNEFNTFMQGTPDDAEVQEKYPLVEWLEYYNYIVPNDWNEDPEYNLIEQIIKYGLEGSLNQLRIANHVKFMNEKNPDEYEEDIDEDYVNNKAMDATNKFRECIFKTISGEHPPVKNALGVKSKRKRNRKTSKTKTKNKKQKARPRKTRKMVK
jgi:hypothetical protein